MSVKHQALPKISTVNQASHRQHVVLEIFAIMTWWERLSFTIVIASTLVCLVLMVLMLNGLA